ncbi:MAG: hypothetical protein AAGB32_05120 [Pseudomonadota bacterium]
MAIKKVTGLLKKLTLRFLEAAYFHVEPVFREAAEGEGSGDSSGVKWHGFNAIGLPGAKYHAMTGQVENSNLVRQARAAGKGFQAQVLDRPDYYGSFEQYNSLKIN